MPIDLTKTAVNGSNVKYTPRFFDKQLIGTGGSIGVINHNTNPGESYRYLKKLTDDQINDQETLMDSFIENAHNYDGEMITEKSFMPNQNTQIKAKLINLLPISNTEMKSSSSSEYSGDDILTYVNISYSDLTKDKLGEWVSLGDGKLKVRLVPSRLLLTQKKSALDKHWLNATVILYNLQLLQAQDANDFAKLADEKVCYDVWKGYLKSNFTFDNDLGELPDDLDCAFNAYSSKKSTDKIFWYNMYTIDPLTLINGLTQKGCYLAPYQDDLVNFINDFSIYDSLCQLSESFQTNLDYFMKLSLKQSKLIKHDDLKILLANISQMQVPLDQYQQLYALLNQDMKNDPDTLNKIIQSNLNLRFNQLLTDLDHEKPNLAAIPKHDNIDPKLSFEQQNAVKSPGPLSLVEAGAGTGKSSVLLSRISYLLKGGIKPEDVLVLSFTNAAAEHINQLYPNVKSMTINAMINQIYEFNYQNQAIVSLTTFLNSLRIEYANQKQDPYIDKLIRSIKDLDTNSEQSSFNRIDRGFQSLTELIDENPKKIIKICTALGQTTFDIQIAICYCGLDQINIPENITAKHILVDEVQDNSTFDFMFLLKYIIFEKASFFIVGDASQTLYAFRNANPYALNILRTSKLFSIYQLTTNFRSKQEILTYANVLLNDISANRFARIQLKSNQLSKPTLDDFKNTVNIQHISGSRKYMKDDILNNFSLKKYIFNCLAKNEKIAFLAYSHATLQVMNNAISQMFGNSKNNVFTDISSSRTNESVIISNFWAHLSKDKRAIYMKTPKTLLLNKIQNDFIHVSLSQKYMNRASLLWTSMINENQAVLTALDQSYINNQITCQVYLKKLTGIMVRYEITHNFKIQQMHRQNNAPKVKQDKINQSNFIFSTIHSSKGLEFDNVILLIDANRFHNNRSEADKRAIYVGLTRAKNSEFILAADACSPQDSMLMENYSFAINELSTATN